jgi:hypothetical protein
MQACKNMRYALLMVGENDGERRTNESKHTAVTVNNAAPASRTSKSNTWYQKDDDKTRKRKPKTDSY